MDIEKPSNSQSQEPLGEEWELPVHEIRCFAKRKCKYCIVTACWNEGEKSYEQYRRMRPYTKELDFIVANRGDDLPDLGDDVLKNEFQIRTLLQIEEPGQSAAYRAALAYGLREGYDGIIMIDSNGKDGVEKMPSFVSHLDEGFDLVNGSRFMNGGTAVEVEVDMPRSSAVGNYGHWLVSGMSRILLDLDVHHSGQTT